MSPLRRLLLYLRPHRAGFLVALALVVLQAGLEVAKPWPLKIIVDRVLGDGAASASPDALSKTQLLLMASLAVILIQVVLSAVALVQNLLTVGIGHQMVSALRSDLLTHLYGQSLGFFGRRPGTDLAYRVTFDTYVETQLAPTLSKGDVVILDNLSSHKGPAVN